MRLNNVVGIHNGALVVVLEKGAQFLSTVICTVRNMGEGGSCISCRYVLVISDNRLCQNLRGKFVHSQFF